MALYLVLKSGPSQGESVLIQEGLTIGRKSQSIELQDSKVSSKHAQIKLEGVSSYSLHDLGSKNGIWSNGIQIQELVLEPGIQFEIGETLFEVQESEELEVQQAPILEPPTLKPKAQKRWNEHLASYLRKNLFNFQTKDLPLTPFRPALVLDFLRGPQTETRWVLGYGPRQIGRLSSDFPIFEEKASDICFEIFSSEEGLCLRSIGQEVRLNGSPVSTEVLKVGDRIQIFETEIEVDFTE